MNTRGYILQDTSQPAYFLHGKYLLNNKGICDPHVMSNRIKDHLHYFQEGAQVCALGNLFLKALKYTKKQDEFMFGWLGRTTIELAEMFPVLLRYFSIRQIELIDTAYENEIALYCDGHNNRLYKAKDFRMDLAGKEKAEAIRLNMLDNGGVFKPY